MGAGFHDSVFRFNAEVTGAGAIAEGTKSGTLLASGWPPG